MRHISYTVVIPNGSAALTTREMMMFDIVVSFNNLKSLSQLYVVDNCNVNIAIIRDYFLSKKLLISDIKHGEYKNTCPSWFTCQIIDYRTLEIVDMDDV